MKKNALFEKCLSGVSPEVREEVRLNMDITNKIHDILKKKNMTQRELAELMGKRESEISRWLTGSHGFTTKTLAKIAAVLGEPIVEAIQAPETKYVFIPMSSYVTYTELSGEYCINNNTSHYTTAYAN